MKFQELINESFETFYHGSNHEIKSFNFNNLRNDEAINEAGPGIYLTSSKQDAEKYGKNILEVEVNIAKSRMKNSGYQKCGNWDGMDLKFKNRQR